MELIVTGVELFAGLLALRLVIAGAVRLRERMIAAAAMRNGHALPLPEGKAGTWSPARS